ALLRAIDEATLFETVKPLAPLLSSVMDRLAPAEAATLLSRTLAALKNTYAYEPLVRILIEQAPRLGPKEAALVAGTLSQAQTVAAHPWGQRWLAQGTASL